MSAFCVDFAKFNSGLFFVYFYSFNHLYTFIAALQLYQITVEMLAFAFQTIKSIIFDSVSTSPVIVDTKQTGHIL